MDADTFIKEAGPLLKLRGFKKSNATWRKDQGESIAVFNVQKSQWGGGVYYLNLGTYFRALGNEVSPTENKCHVRVRLDVKEPSATIAAAMAWFQERALLQDAMKLAEADSKKGLVFKALRDSSAT